MKVTASYRFETPDAAKIYACLLPESEDPVSDRSVIRLFLVPPDGSSESAAGMPDTLVLEIESCDITSMRSATNTWLRLIMTGSDVASCIRKRSRPAPPGCHVSVFLLFLPPFPPSSFFFFSFCSFFALFFLLFFSVPFFLLSFFCSFFLFLFFCSVFSVPFFSSQFFFCSFFPYSPCFRFPLLFLFSFPFLFLFF